MSHWLNSPDRYEMSHVISFFLITSDKSLNSKKCCKLVGSTSILMAAFRGLKPKGRQFSKVCRANDWSDRGNLLRSKQVSADRGKREWRGTTTASAATVASQLTRWGLLNDRALGQRYRPAYVIEQFAKRRCWALSIARIDAVRWSQIDETGGWTSWAVQSWQI